MAENKMKKIELQCTKSFEKDLKKFSPSDQKKIIAQIDKFLYTKKNDLDLFQPYKVRLKDNLGSSLYVLRVSSNIRLLLTMDNDPLFNQILITFMRVVKRADLDKTYKNVAEFLYQDWLK